MTFTFNIAQVFKRVYESFDEIGSFTCPSTLSKVAGVKKKLALEYLQNELSYTLHRVSSNYYQKTKAFVPLYTLKLNFMTLDETQSRHNGP